MKQKLNVAMVVTPLIYFLLAFLPASLFAQQTLDDLVSAERLSVKASLSPLENIIPTQKVTLSIEIATDRWFAGGTRIGSLEVPHAVALQRQKFAINSTRREGGKTWARQVWETEIYPRKAGIYQVPPVEVSLTINADSGLILQGTVMTSPLTFVVENPAGAPENLAWVATPSLILEENWDKDLSELTVGDARVRTLTVKADALPGMMLSQIDSTEIPGVAIYPKPAEVQDFTSRGQSSSQRTQTNTYFFEQPGAYSLSEVQVHWWNVDSKTWEIARIPGTVLNVSPNPTASTVQEFDQRVDQSTQWRNAQRLGLVVIIAILLLMLLMFLVRRFVPQTTNTRTTPAKAEKACWILVKQAIAKENSLEAVAALYKWLPTFTALHGHRKQTSLGLLSDTREWRGTIDRLLASAYGKPGELKINADQVLSQLKSIRRKARKAKIRQAIAPRISIPFSARLN